MEVHMGCELPLASTLVPWGIQGLTLPHYENESDTSAKVHPDHLPLPLTKGNISEPRAAVWLVQKLMSMPDHSVTLVPVGPLTNIALAIRADDRIVRKISRVVMMGGTHDTYAPTQGSEFNIWVDPEAAEILFRADSILRWFHWTQRQAQFCHLNRLRRLDKLVQHQLFLLLI